MGKRNISNHLNPFKFQANSCYLATINWKTKKSKGEFYCQHFILAFIGIDCLKKQTL